MQVEKKKQQSWHSPFLFDKFVKKFDDDTRMKLEFVYLKSEELLKDFSDDDLREEFKRLTDSLDRKSVSAQLAGLEMDIKKAEQVGDFDTAHSLLQQFLEQGKGLN